eukprot:2158182-Pleurochrysis_carterae.AAC.1
MKKGNNFNRQLTWVAPLTALAPRSHAATDANATTSPLHDMAVRVKNRIVYFGIAIYITMYRKLKQRRVS